MPPTQPPPLTDKTKTVLRAVAATAGRTAKDIAGEVGLPPAAVASLLSRLIGIGLVVDYRSNNARVYRVATGSEAAVAAAVGVPGPIEDRTAASHRPQSRPGVRPEPGVWRLRDLRAAVDRGDMPRGVLEAAERELASSRRLVTRAGNSTPP